jgi:uncharacterized Ntn-hydrolase superfamily protein
MTFSIVARSADGTHLGVAVASKFLAVGAAVPAAAAGIGAVATQAWANVAYKRQALALLGTGVDAARVVAGLTAADPKAADRQLGVVGATGDGATFTGPGCHPWAGGRAGDGYAIQGNILTGPEVVDAMRDAWLAGADQPFRAGCCPRSGPATRPVATRAAGSRPRCSWSRRARATTAATTSRWTCGSTTTRPRSRRWPAWSTSTSCCSASPIRPPCCRSTAPSRTR